MRCINASGEDEATDEQAVLRGELGGVGVAGVAGVEVDGDGLFEGPCERPTGPLRLDRAHPTRGRRCRAGPAPPMTTIRGGALFAETVMLDLGGQQLGIAGLGGGVLEPIEQLLGRDVSS
jgi:hypothetical protein